MCTTITIGLATQIANRNHRFDPEIHNEVCNLEIEKLIVLPAPGGKISSTKLIRLINVNIRKISPSLFTNQFTGRKKRNL